jgi:saccharopine dehydrogenase-like NADP-dependent oxidoreductase
LAHILLFGAGKSATVLIHYLVQECTHRNWSLTVVDANLELAQKKTLGAASASAHSFDIRDAETRIRFIRESDLVISMLPPTLHILVAMDCLQESKHLLTASYKDPGMIPYEKEIKDKGLLFLCEMGLDPGIDHMSAMKMIKDIQDKGGSIHTFLSHCGGLVAPESDNNPWHYKISWNPRNVVLAGKAGAIYRQDNSLREISYQQLFRNDQLLHIPGYDEYAWYANRDSLSYMPLYGLEDSRTFIRTTLRHPDFIKGWKHVVALNLTEEDTRDYVANNFVPAFMKTHLEKQGAASYFQEHSDPLLVEQFSSLGFTDNSLMIPSYCQSPADVLQWLMESHWVLQQADKDRIVMMHEIGYALEEQEHLHRTFLVVDGKDSLHTAMAKTVGLPLAIAAILVLEGKIQLSGIHVPVMPEIYDQVLPLLEKEGIAFKEI